MRKLFDGLRADGKQIALASSAKEEEVALYKKIADISDLVDAETSSDDVSRSKPHPDIFESALGKLTGLLAQNIIVIGDTPYDAEAGRKTGLRTVGVLCGGFPESELRRAGCLAIYRDPADMLRNYLALEQLASR